MFGICNGLKSNSTDFWKIFLKLMNIRNFKAVLVFRNKQQQQRNRTKMGRMLAEFFSVLLL